MSLLCLWLLISFREKDKVPKMAYKLLHNLFSSPNFHYFLPSSFFSSSFPWSGCLFPLPEILFSQTAMWLTLYFFQVTLIWETCPDFSILPCLTPVTPNSPYFVLFFSILRKYKYRVTSILCMFACELLPCVKPLECTFSGTEDLNAVSPGPRTSTWHIAHIHLFIRQKRKTRAGKRVRGR